MARLQLDSIRKAYGNGEHRFDALRGVSITLESGDFTALRGPSGCGKSTLLHIAGAMDRPSEGSVTLAGQRLDTLSQHGLALVRRRRIGFVFQAFNLLPTLTAEENVALPSLLDGLAERRAAAIAAEALGEVGLSDKRRSYPPQLSGGEMQRVAIARALAIEPQLLIADEPTGSLDSETGNAVLRLLRRLNDQRGLTILMATHSAEAAGFARSQARLRDGLLEDTGEPHASPCVV